MGLIDQNIALASQEEALVPLPHLIDGRTERDRLSFLANFASVINFYDHNNKLNGNWKPFLLKDPLILLAYISKTNYQKLYSLYRQSCHQLQSTLNSPSSLQDLGTHFNLLFDQILGIFQQIERWTFFMQKSKPPYTLKDFVLKQVERKYSTQFWALLAFKQELYSSQVIPGITQVDASRYEAFKDLVWKSPKGNSPFEVVLGLKNPLNSNTDLTFFQALKAAGDLVFQFFHQIIEYSVAAFDALQNTTGNFPDTSLLRVFVKLLSISQAQLNTISGKHLKFYFEDILKQSRKLAEPDKAFICLELAKKDTVFNLPASSSFFAGLNANKQAILFRSLENQCLNPGNIVQAYTLASKQLDNNYSHLFLQSIAHPGVVKKDEAGKIQHWPSFGSTDASHRAAQFGFAFASPMLLLKEGSRTLNIEISFSTEIGKDFFEAASYYLSSPQKWIQTHPTVSYGESDPLKFDFNHPVVNNTIKLSFVLKASDPPIDAFLKNPDELQSQWPMFKMTFDLLPDLANPPSIEKITVRTDVQNFKNFKLYNDNGAINPKKPFQVFGGAPDLYSSFFIGSAEIFSKPFTFFNIEIDWDKLPKDFKTYYLLYNYLFNNHYQELDDELVKKKSVGNVFESLIKDLGIKKDEPAIKLLNSIKKVLGIAKKEEMGLEPHYPFNNSCFGVSFSYLNAKSWEPFEMEKKLSCQEKEGKFICTPYVPGKHCIPPKSKDSHPLFSTSDLSSSPEKNALRKVEGAIEKIKNLIEEKAVDDPCRLTESSCFAYSTEPEKSAQIIPQPNLQLKPLVYTDESSYGFVKMQLSSPREGFGKDLYPQVISAIALANALAIVNKEMPIPNIVNPPFVPKIKGFTGNYSAEKTYNFKTSVINYPLQCFYYTPFKNYPIYDTASTTIDTSVSGEINNLVGDSPKSESKGISLFPPFPYKGRLYLALKDLLAPSELNLLFELTPTYTNSPSDKTPEITYQYLSETGWESLPVLSDGTQDFACSGIIKLNIPSGIAKKHATMPGDTYWISLAVNHNADIPNVQTVYLKANGIEVERTGNSFLTHQEVPQIPSNTIQKPYPAIPQISLVEQAFPSFGGKAAENTTSMNQRVSTRLKTKDRALFTEDYFRLIRQANGTIYFSKAVNDPKSRSQTTNIYLVKCKQNWKAPNAFTPTVSNCEKLHIKAYLEKRASPFANIQVSNFQFEYVQVKADFSIKPGFEWEGVTQALSQSLNVFLSPWIKSKDKQIAIDQGISAGQIAGFIRKFEGVDEVGSISFPSVILDHESQEKILWENGSFIEPKDPSYLLVPAKTHVFNRIVTT